MSTFRGSKVKRSRSLGVALTPKAQKVMDKKTYPPGQHGPTKRVDGKMSDYKRQLLEKQRVRAQYNISERQMVNYYKKASARAGITGDNLVQLLETRLDAVVLRGGLARSIFQARQAVSHGHILVNGKRVDIPSYQVKPNDVISVREKSRRVPMFTESVKAANPPEYLSLNKPNMAVTLVDIPTREQVPVMGEFSLVIEFYSR